MVHLPGDRKVLYVLLMPRSLMFHTTFFFGLFFFGKWGLGSTKSKIYSTITSQVSEGPSDFNNFFFLVWTNESHYVSEVGCISLLF